MSINFNTLQNKEFLWKLMYETKLFDGLDNSMVSIIQSHFENKMKRIDINKKEGDSLILLNKQVVQEMLSDIKTKNIKTKNMKNSFQTPNEHIILDETIITAQDITKNRQHFFEEQLKTMKNEFEQMISVPKPKLIEFSDKNSGNEIVEENTDIEQLLAETIAKRENMLITINDVDKNKASQWINNNREETSLKKISPSMIKISSELIEPTNIIDNMGLQNNNEEKKNRKNVTFDESMNFIPINDITENNQRDINIREHTINIKNIHMELKEINEKLNKIMELLEK